MFKEVFSYLISILLVSWGQMKVVQKKVQERMMGKRQIERDLDREGKKVNEMERKSGQGRQGAEEGGKEISI